ncbi:MAG: hypothetical protein JNL74_15700 [Fibrobacteres bacterium]|nr:hypothetical protein [Fibrobacterota bacterium]
MAAVFNFQEVYEIGIQIEQNGLAFYRHFSSKAKDDKAKKVLRELALWEEKHFELFTKLRNEEAVKLSGVEPIDQNGEAAAYLRSLADSHVFLRSFDLDDMSRELHSDKLVLQKALHFEKDSVKLYESLLDNMPDEFGKEAVRRLAEEEIKHVEMITHELASL